MTAGTAVGTVISGPAATAGQREPAPGPVQGAAPEDTGHPVEDNSHAGQGSVLLDIGGDVGALVVYAPAAMDGVELEIAPAGATRGTTGAHDAHDHHYPHVAVLARPTPTGARHAAVFGSLAAGRYEVYEKLGAVARLPAEVRGGEVTQLDWAAAR